MKNIISFPVFPYFSIYKLCGLCFVLHTCSCFEYDVKSTFIASCTTSVIILSATLFGFYTGAHSKYFIKYTSRDVRAIV